MAHKPRIHYPCTFYHVMLCGNGGQDIFFFDADHSRFHLLLQEDVERYNHRIHAFCQMTNHIHLAIKVKLKGGRAKLNLKKTVMFMYRKNKVSLGLILTETFTVEGYSSLFRHFLARIRLKGKML